MRWIRKSKKDPKKKRRIKSKLKFKELKEKLDDLKRKLKDNEKQVREAVHFLKVVGGLLLGIMFVQLILFSLVMVFVVPLLK